VVVLGRFRRRLLQVRPEDGQLGATSERGPARQALVEQTAERSAY
jgi:hypothetical protein